MMPAAPNLNVRMEGTTTAVVEIYDDIGPSWAGMIDTRSVARELEQLGDGVKQIEVRINSRGGSAYEGIGIHNLLKQHPAQVKVVVIGLAGSAASVIAMAGDSIEMPRNTLMMIHEPWIITLGNQQELRKTADMLGKVNESAIESYQAKSGQPRSVIAKWLSEETWFTAAEAVESKLADVVIDKDAEPEQLVSREPFQFERPPEQLSRLLEPGGPRMAHKTTAPNMPANQPPASPEPPADPAQQQPPADPPAAQQPPADPPAATEPVDVQAQISQALAADRKRQSDIRAMCNTAGFPQLGDHFATSTDPEYSVEEVRTELYNRLVKQNRSPGDPGEQQGEEKDPDQKYKDEYRADRAVYQAAGLSEEDYIVSRRIDDGLDVLQVGSAAEAAA